MCFAYRSSFLKSLLLLCRWITSETEVFNFIFIFHQIFWWKVSSILLAVNLTRNSENIFFFFRISFWNTSWNTSLLMFQEPKKMTINMRRTIKSTQAHSHKPLFVSASSLSRAMPKLHIHFMPGASLLNF